MDKVKLGEGEMDGVAFQHLDDGAFEQTDARPCTNVTRAAVEDEQQWGLEQCGCRQETEVRLARKSIGFLPTITSNSTSNSIEQLSQRENNLNLNSRGEFLAPTVQTTRREEFLVLTRGAASSQFSQDQQHSALSTQLQRDSHPQEKLLSVHHTNAISLRREIDSFSF